MHERNTRESPWMSKIVALCCGAGGLKAPANFLCAANQLDGFLSDERVAADMPWSFGEVLVLPYIEEGL
jgi:hypothetical protein